jgi:hypothetical protein
MQVTRISANVRYSKQMPDGAFKTVELGAEGSLDSSDETWQEAQAALYHQLGDQLRYVFNGNGAGKPQNGSQDHVQPLPEPPLPFQHHSMSTGARSTRPHFRSTRRTAGPGIAIGFRTASGVKRGGLHLLQCRSPFGWPRKHLYHNYE